MAEARTHETKQHYKHSFFGHELVYGNKSFKDVKGKVVLLQA
jgi:hypothetical protein